MPESLRIGDEWILAQRGPRNAVDPRRPYAFLVEPELMPSGRVEDVGVIFITNRECPFRCLMCDLWKNTTIQPVPAGAVTAQVEWAMARMPPVRHVKLYNAGNFFDRKAIARAEWEGIARCLATCDTVIIESHPLLVGEDCVGFREMLRGRIEIAMGLETIDPAVLPRLNKRMTTEDFAQACRFLAANAIAVRAFILLRAPFQSEADGLTWACRSIEWAFEQGVECCVLIPTRDGNGAMERLAERGEFEPPSIASLLKVAEYGVSLGRGRVFADLWDIERFVRSDDDHSRIARLRELNATQKIRTPGVESAAAG